MSGLSFGQNAEGKWGYKPSGADAVIPFRSLIKGDSLIIPISLHLRTNSNQDAGMALRSDFSMTLNIVGAKSYTCDGIVSSAELYEDHVVIKINKETIHRDVFNNAGKTYTGSVTFNF